MVEDQTEAFDPGRPRDVCPEDFPLGLIIVGSETTTEEEKTYIIFCTGLSWIFVYVFLKKLGTTPQNTHKHMFATHAVPDNPSNLFMLMFGVTSTVSFSETWEA